ncbi:MAG: transposase, partial [bacterium]|nr:transposase [bacterium]
MEIQRQVGRSLRGDLTRLREVLDGAMAQGVHGLGQVADRVCEAFDFRDGRGRWQRASCSAALADLEAAGHVSLPRDRPSRGGARGPRVFPQPVAPAVDVPATVGELPGLGEVGTETGDGA